MQMQNALESDLERSELQGSHHVHTKKNTVTWSHRALDVT